MDNNDEQMEDTGKTMAERALEIGRDGAYLEINADDLVASHKDGRLEKAKMVVLKVARIELSDIDVASLLARVREITACPNPQLEDMSDDQLGNYLIRRALVYGLYSAEDKKS